jgi:ribosome-binding ATPase
MASLEIGIVGLPNVGKTTIFNALTNAGAEVTEYAAVQSTANVGVANVPDSRLVELAVVAGSRETIYATVQIADVSGLSRGAGQGGSLGGAYLGHLRASDALVHVVRTFRDESVFHVDGRVDPVADAEAVDLELVLDKAASAQVDLLTRLQAHLDAGEPARSFGEPLPDDLDLLSRKPLLYLANTSEAGDADAVAALSGYAGATPVVAVAGRFEAELAELDDPEERAAFLAAIGQDEAGMPRVARAAFQLLDLITFFTVGPKEARAWPLRRGSTALEAAGKIHTDIARGFIRAEVITTADMIATRTHAEAQRRGVMRVEGRDYVIADGDVVNVRFNV